MAGSRASVDSRSRNRFARSTLANLMVQRALDRVFSGGPHIRCGLDRQGWVNNTPEHTDDQADLDTVTGPRGDNRRIN